MRNVGVISRVTNGEVIAGIVALLSLLSGLIVANQVLPHPTDGPESVDWSYVVYVWAGFASLVCGFIIIGIRFAETSGRSWPFRLASHPGGYCISVFIAFDIVIPIAEEAIRRHETPPSDMTSLFVLIAIQAVVFLLQRFFR